MMTPGARVTPRPTARERRRLTALLSGLLAALIGLGTTGGATMAAAEDATRGIPMAPHEARYELRMMSRAPGSTVVDARGDMRYRFVDTCDGWTMESRTTLDLYYSYGNPVHTEWSLVSWESKEGDQYRFRVRSENNGTVDQIIDGRVRMNDDGRGGVVTFSKPDDSTLDLAPDVLLPMKHTLAVLEAARDGQRIFTAPMFDGSDPEGPMLATAVLTEAVPAGETSELPDHPLLKGPSWRLVLSFFAPDSAGSLPEYELQLRYHANGVAEEVIQDFGTMSLRASLKDLIAIEDGGC
jgi:hypothetical protein